MKVQGTAAELHRRAAAPPEMLPVTWSAEEEARAARAELILTSIDFSEKDGTLTLSLGRCFEACIGLKVRQTQARRQLKSALKSHCLLRWQSEAVASVQLTDPWTGPDLLRELVAAHLTEVASRPLTPRLLVAALGITGRERLRGTKDGRLKQSGSVTISRGQVVSVPIYAISDVELLANNSGIFARWRTDDCEV